MAKTRNDEFSNSLSIFIREWRSLGIDDTYMAQWFKIKILELERLPMCTLHGIDPCAKCGDEGAI